MLFEPWHQFHHPLVRQLAFVIASPNIIRALPSELDLPYAFELHPPATWQHYYAAYAARLQALDHNPQPIYDFLAPLRSTRLGLRFEYLMWFWLSEQHYHPYKLMGHSLQQISGRHTVGELDFLLLNTHSNEIEHWEVALKYYLGHVSYQMQDWIGLNDADTLARKLNHFGQKQFQFNDIQGHPIQRKYAVIKGQLYRPFTLETPTSHHAATYCAETHSAATYCAATYFAMDHATAGHPKTRHALVSQAQWQPPAWIETERQLGQWRHDLPQQHEQHNYRRLLRHEWICPDASAESPKIHWWTNGLYQIMQPDTGRTTAMMLKLQHHPQVPYLNLK